ncbi:MAG: glycerophosphodiester phosphodiesterase family protein [Dehalococcoidia bacterium]
MSDPLRATPAGWPVAPGSRDVPLIIAHRGFSAAAPENTLQAFQLALDAGADGVELDVRLTRDRRVAVFHDRRVDRTTSARGPVGTFTLAQLQSLDVGSWFDPRFKGARAVTLEEVFDALPHDFLVNVELKVRGLGVNALASRVVEIVRRCRRFDSTVVASFNPLALALVARMEPRIIRGYAWNRRHPLPLRRRWFVPLGRPRWMDPDLMTFTPALLDTLHRQGRPVMAWDVDTGQDLRSLCAMRLDAIVTDDPGQWVRLREQLLRERAADVGPTAKVVS